MKRRRHLRARLDRMRPPPGGGGVRFFEDIESGAVWFDHLPPGRGGYLVVHRACATAEEWRQKYWGVQPVASKGSL